MNRLPAHPGLLVAREVCRPAGRLAPSGLFILLPHEEWNRPGASVSA